MSPKEQIDFPTRRPENLLGLDNKEFKAALEKKVDDILTKAGRIPALKILSEENVKFIVEKHLKEKLKELTGEDASEALVNYLGTEFIFGVKITNPHTGEVVETDGKGKFSPYFEVFSNGTKDTIIK